MRVGIWGTGGDAKKFISSIGELVRYEDTIICVCDSNQDKWGNKLGEYTIVSPRELVSQKLDKYIIASGKYSKEIYEQLMKLGCPEQAIETYDRYYRRNLIHDQYYYRYHNMGSVKTDSGQRLSCANTVVYTAITGGYDNLKDPIFVENGIKYVCYTNNKQLSSNVWEIRYVNSNHMSDVMLARYIKLHPNDYFKEYEYSIWVDGKYEIRDNLIEYAQKYLRDTEMLCFPHYYRKCLYDEAATCIYVGKGNKEDIIRQISSYYNEGIGMNMGLYETGCIVRKHSDIVVQRIMEEWWEELSEYSYRDQLSLPVVFCRNNFIPDISDLDIEDNKYLVIRDHTK